MRAPDATSSGHRCRLSAGWRRTGWVAQYFDRVAAKDPHRPRVEALERHLKWGTSRRYWPEFVFEGYVNHQPGAIFLKGLPDVPKSRPHSREYVRHADGH
jgi:hypothetical protein